MIKSKIIETTKARILLVDRLPEDASHIHYVELHGNPIISYHWPIGSQYLEIVPPGNWQSLNFLDKVTEDEAEKIVDDVCFGDSSAIYKGFRDYIKIQAAFDTSLKSLHSLVEANVPLRNPLGTEEEYVKSKLKEKGFRWNPGYKSWDGPEYRIGTPLVITDLSENEIIYWRTKEEQVYHTPFLFWEKK